MCLLMLLSIPAFSQQVPTGSQQLPAGSQQLLRGRIRRKASEEVLLSVSVINRSQKKTNLSDLGGNYRIPAKKGDTVIFSSAGYKPDTTIVNNWMFEEKDGYQVFLEPNALTLPTVRVGEQSNYQLDSLKRKEEYAWLYPVHPRKLVGSETVTDGFGISISPIDYFSSKETQRRRLRHRLAQEEKDYYIDSRFLPRLCSPRYRFKRRFPADIPIPLSPQLCLLPESDFQ